jgi:prepilin-type N-terminal cleavage/methylation domain-containing protein
MDTRLKPRQRIQSAFTLIELLVVIAIIAILAAIIFPTFAAVREQARQSSTLSNMHAVYVGAKLFNEDEGRYPSVLFGYAEAVDNNLANLNPKRPPQRPYLPGDAFTSLVSMDQAKEFFATYLGQNNEGVNRGYLYPEQVKDYVTFTTPDNLVKDKRATTVAYYPLNSAYKPGQVVVWEGPVAGACAITADRDLPSNGLLGQPDYTGQPKLYYIMDSMDIGPRLNADGSIFYESPGKPRYELHYSPDWSRSLGRNCEDKNLNNNGKNYVTQLKYKNPPTDSTVLTYVTQHVATNGSTKVMVILLSGTAKKMDVQAAANQLPMNYKP